MADNTKNGNVVSLTCHSCGKTFSRKVHRVRSVSAYCSRECINHSLGAYRKRPYEWLFNKLQHYAKHRGIFAPLTYEEYLLFTRLPDCHYCGAALIWSPHRTTSHRSGAYYLDRKDPKEGYVRDNLVTCCGSCNRTKGDRFSYEQFIEIGRVIKTFAR